MASSLLLFAIKKWKKAMTAPSNSVSPLEVMVIGEKLFQRIVSAVLAAMKTEIPELSPYPF